MTTTEEKIKILKMAMLDLVIALQEMRSSFDGPARKQIDCAINDAKDKLGDI